MPNFKRYYDFSIITFALTSVILVILDLSGKINLSLNPYKTIDLIILSIFWIDYIARISSAKNKKLFFKNNILDLIAIIPLNQLFAMFRIFRVFRIVRLAKITKLARIFRSIAFLGKINKKTKVFLKTNNFIYVLYASVGLIFTSSMLMMYLENQSFADALWWSIVTCTTVGYGDISPSTVSGRIIAVVLMIFGIGLIGMLTGTITTYFTQIKPNIDNELSNDSDILSTLSDEEIEKVTEYVMFLRSKV